MKRVLGLVAVLSIFFGALYLAFPENIPEYKTETLWPSGPGMTGWVPWNSEGCGAGATVDNWRCVDEQVLKTGDYVYSGTNNRPQAFQFTKMHPEGDIGIAKVTAYYYAKGYGPSRYQVRPVVKSTVGVGNVLKEGPIMDLGEEYEYVAYTWDVDPSTGEPWALDDINSIEAGLKTANSLQGGAQVAQVYLEITYYTK